MEMIKYFLCFILCCFICTTLSANKVSLRVGKEYEGVSSYYHRSLNGNKTANGERYRHMGALTAAHRNMPFGTKLLVTNEESGKSIVVKINDRGPFVKGRMLDLSGLAAKRLGIVKQGLCKVHVKVISIPPPKRSKDTLGDFIYQQNNFNLSE